jgi:hypothetical protein
MIRSVEKSNDLVGNRTRDSFSETQYPLTRKYFQFIFLLAYEFELFGEFTWSESDSQLMIWLKRQTRHFNKNAIKKEKIKKNG